MGYVAALYHYGPNATTVTPLVGPFETEPEADRWTDRHPPASVDSPHGVWRVQRLESPYSEPVPSAVVLEQVAVRLGVSFAALRDAFERNQP